MLGKSDPKFYLNLSFCFYGIGAILGPIIIALLALKGSLLIGICIFFISPGFLLIPSVEKKN